MKKLFIALLIFLGIHYHLQAAIEKMFIDSEGYHNLANEEQSAVFQKMSSSLKKLEGELHQYIDYRSSIIKENEEYLKKTGQWEAQLNEEVNFQKSLKKLEELFLTFRSTLHNVVIENLGPSPYSYNQALGSDEDLTDWYIAHIRKNILDRR